MFAGIEAGGTKFVCAVAEGPDTIHAITRFPTTTPDQTINRAIEFFKEQDVAIDALGIASFGPVDPNPQSPTYGHITTTPKAGWAHTPLAQPIAEALNVPFVFDTDVNGAALGESRWGAAQNLNTVLYITVGTGIGGGAIVRGQRLHGLIHPEMGHLQIPMAPGDTFAGICPFHGNCLEGMATGPALEARWGRPAIELPPDHEAWDIEAHYLAMACANYLLTLSPQRIIMGGGVMDQQHLFPRIRARLSDILNGYVKSPHILEHIDNYIVPPALGNKAGVLGAIALAMEAA